MLAGTIGVFVTSLAAAFCPSSCVRPGTTPKASSPKETALRAA